MKMPMKKTRQKNERTEKQKRAVKAQMNSSAASRIMVTDEETAYDSNAKYLLSEKIFLAHILGYAVPEFEGMSPNAIVPLIEGTPEVGTTPVYPGESNLPVITGNSQENAIPYEGRVSFDIRFFANVPDGKQYIKLLFDVEIQKDYYPGYDLVTRGLFYGARMLSSQLGTEFEDSQYDDIKKVYSIWICTNVPEFAKNTITEYSVKKNNLFGKMPDKNRYDLISVIMILLPKAIPSAEYYLQRFLGTLLSEELSHLEKKSILKQEYGIDMTKEMDRRLDIMCNLSQGIKEKGRAEGMKQERIRAIQALLRQKCDKKFILKLGYTEDEIKNAEIELQI